MYGKERTKDGFADTGGAMVTRRGMLGILGTVGASALLAITGCSDSGEGGAESSASDYASTSTSSASSSGSVLVAYYSATGNTRAVAERLAEDLGADVFEVVPEDPYSEEDLDFNDDDSRVVAEHEDDSRRDVPLEQTTPDGFEGYDTVLVGYPIWWGEAAWPIDRFVSDNDFTGKRVVTFCTSQASGLGGTTEDLADMAGTGDWEEGRRFPEDPDDSDVDDFADSI